MDTFKDFIQLIFKPSKKFIFSGPPFLYGWFALIRDEFFPSNLAEKWRLGGVFREIDWYWWVIAGITIWGLSIAWEATKQASVLKKRTVSSIKASTEGSGLALALRDNYGTINQVAEKDKPVHRVANFRVEAVRLDNLVGLRFYNDELIDFVDKRAEMVGFGSESSTEKPVNTMEVDMIIPEKRELAWENGDSKIGCGDHDLIKVVMVDERGMHFCLRKTNITMLHNADQATFKIGIEIRGKLGNDPIIPKRYCITFSIRKDILEDKGDKKIWWAIVMPTLVEGDCDYAITMSAEEFLQKMKKLM